MGCAGAGTSKQERPLNDLSHYRSGQPAHLTTGARLVRGFKRVGVVAAAITWVGGIVFTAVISTQQGNNLQGGFRQATCAKQLKPGSFVFNEFRPQEIDLSRSGCSGPLYTRTWAEINAIASSKPSPLEGYIEPASLGFLMSSVAAVLVFGLFWIIGWVFAGFTKD